MGEQKYAGAGWIKKQSYGRNISPLGEQVADLLGDVFAGIYHIDNQLLSETDWTNSHWIAVRLDSCLSTFDNPLLTWLVVLAHDRLLRLQINAVGERRLELQFHLRKSRTGFISQRLPTMEEHLASIRKFHPAPAETEAVAHG